MTRPRRLAAGTPAAGAAASFRAPSFRAAIAALFALALAACAPPDADLAGPVEPLGAFRLGYNIVVADGTDTIEPTRNVTEEEWEEAFRRAIDERFSRFEGDQLYHIAVSVNGYFIAPTSIPVVAPTKSVAIIGVTIWDDAAGGKINEEPEIINVFERVDAAAGFIGSGATMTREEQVENIAENGARLIELWMRRNPEWFAPREGAATDVRIENNRVVGADGAAASRPGGLPGQ
jgi:hypothetical protein